MGGKQSGGQNNYVRQLAEALAGRGLSIDVVTHWSAPDTPQVERFGGSCRVIRIAAGRNEFVPKSEMLELLPAFYKEMKAIIDLNAYDVVHTHYWLSGLLGLRIRNDYGTRIVHTSHSLGIAKAKATGQVEEARLRAEKEILGRADRVIATTPTEKDMILDFAGMRSSVSVVSIGVGRSFEQASSAAVKGESPLFVYAGRFEQTKGILTLLRAFRLFLRQGRDARLILAGGATEDIDPKSGLPMKARLRAAVAGMENRVTFLGPLGQRELADLFCHATAVIVPSYYESFGMVAAEAQACGTPVIASEVGGLQDVVQDGRTGLLVSAKNPAELSRGMRRIAGDPEFAGRLGRQALERARNVFNWSAIAADIHEIYEVLYRAEDPVSVGD
ncbi:D-inositol-3-phosphate glycosyltransferase [Bhargavaea cecembensis DSE10]|uniref:D-inositol-3-phosphate glycosyltransferase n=1 Tax=Bhargavaea cecembensis DSE10 TaxID=1235279 RepID=M7N8H8_9BACL|nr:D-inositol-3-phosphate glycosyltransferase [Bhargavaea cecembensis DSE10]